MQVPLIDRLNDLQVGLNSLQNPSSFPSSQITSSFNGIQSVSIAYNFCKWGAVILALVATFGSIINRVIIFIIHLRDKAPSLPSIVFDDGDDYSTSDDDFDDQNDDEDDVVSYLSSEVEDEPFGSSSFHQFGEFFKVRGSEINDNFQSQNDGGFKHKHKRRRSIGDIFSLSELANTESVVKLWDSIGFGFGLGLDFDDYEDDVVFSYDDKPPATASSAASPVVVVAAGEGTRGNLELGIWDTRLRRRKPTVVAEWGPTNGNTLRVESSGVQKVYVRDDGRYGVTVGDMRNVSTPLTTVTESDADSTWFDADTVIASDES